MIVFTGITLVLFYLINLFTNGFANIISRIDSRAEEIKNKNYHTDEDLEEAKALFIKAIGFLIMFSIILVMYISFLITAISVDIFVIPTLIMITEFVGTTLLNFIFKKKIDKDDSKKTGLSLKQYFISSLRISYVIYILVLIFI